MIVVGIDPSLTSTGIAVVDTDDPLVIDVHRVQSKGTRADTWPQRLARIEDVTDRVTAVVAADHPGSDGMVVIESPSLSSRNAGSAHDRSGLWWAMFARLRGLGVTVVPVPPANRAKYATGRGNAPKDAVMLAAAKRYPQAYLTGNDEADAVILAAIGARLGGQPIEDSIPKANLDALTKLTQETP